MFKMGLLLSKQLPFTAAEFLFFQTVARHINVLGAAQQITISSFFSLFQRQTLSLFSKQPTKKENEEEDPLENFVLVLNKKSLLTEKYFPLSEEMMQHIEQQNQDNIICIFKKDPPSNFPSIGSILYGFISNFITQDVTKIACTNLGSHLAAGAFTMTASTPSLIGLPVYYFSEMGIAWLGGYIGGQGGKVLLGDYVLGTLLKRGQLYFSTEPDSNPSLPEIELNDTLPAAPAHTRVVCAQSLGLPLLETYFNPEIETKRPFTLDASSKSPTNSQMKQ